MSTSTKKKVKVAEEFCGDEGTLIAYCIPPDNEDKKVGGMAPTKLSKFGDNEAEVLSSRFVGIRLQLKKRYVPTSAGKWKQHSCAQHKNCYDVVLRRRSGCLCGWRY